MSQNIGKNTINPKIKAVSIIVLLLVIGLVVGLIISQISMNYASDRIGRQHKDNDKLSLLIRSYADMYTLETTFICINIFLLFGLLFIYLDTLKKTQSTFMMGLLLFIGVLLVQSILSLPILQTSLSHGYHIPTLISILPAMFETIALIILLYLSME